MNGDERFVDDLDADVATTAMADRLRMAAARSPTPALPPEIEALPWTVQRSSRPAASGWFRRGFGGSSVAHAFAGVARLAGAVVVSGVLLFALTQVRGSAGGSENIVRPLPPSSVGSPGATGPQVVVIVTSGPVDDVMAGFVSGQIQQAVSAHAAAAVVQLDTLGGSESSMERIVTALDAKIPTIVWVGPTGARAASAGTFITLAANLDYMATGTNIGAASPVLNGGADIAATLGQTEAQKAMQFAISKIQSIAEKRHPQAADWAVTTVRDAKAYSAQEAVAAHAVNGIAETLNDVLAQANGQVVTIAGQPVTVQTAGASIVEVTEDPVQALLHMLDDPNIAFILLVIGVLCVLVEFFHPTLIVGLTGALAIALSFYGSGSLPLNVLGVVLVVLGIAMLVLEPSVPSHGLLSIGGLICFVVGAVAFYGSPGPYLPAVSVAWPIIGTMTAVAAAFALLFVRTALSMRHVRLAADSGMVGTVTPIGQVGEVRAELAPLGTVYVAGEAWSARSTDGAIPSGTRVRVVEQDGLTLVVEPEE